MLYWMKGSKKDQRQGQDRGAFGMHQYTFQRNILLVAETKSRTRPLKCSLTIGIKLQRFYDSPLVLLIFFSILLKSEPQEIFSSPNSVPIGNQEECEMLAIGTKLLAPYQKKKRKTLLTQGFTEGANDNLCSLS